MANRALRDIYEFYKEEKDGQLEWKDFKQLCGRFNKRVMEEIIYGGKALEMGANLSFIKVVRIRRNHDKSVVNWGASNKKKKEILERGGTPKGEDNPDGEDWLIYFTDEWYARFRWKKKYCKVPYHTYYRFDATRGSVGNKRKLKDYINNDDFALLEYDEAE